MFTKQTISKYTKRLHPLKGVIIFIVVMMLANWFWKIFVHDGNDDTIVTFLGIDITLPFRLMQKEVVRVSGLVFELFNIPFSLSHGNVFEFANHNSTEIVWGCTGIKQAFIFICIMMASRGPWRHKCWYIPAGLIVVHVVNVIRISLVGLVINHNPAAFDMVHSYFFKYIFYLILFLMWAMWEEYFFKKEQQESDKFSEQKQMDTD